MTLLRILLFVLVLTRVVLADGFVRPPIDYKGSLEERSQEAIIIFREGTATKSAVQDLIIKIRVEGDASNFAWIVPLPNPPKTTKESPKLFKELHRYVQARKSPPRPKEKSNGADGEKKPLSQATPEAVEVVSREVVGKFDVAVVKENRAGVLNEWLRKEGFQSLPGGEELIEEYRRKGYVFACTKVNEVTLAKGASQAELHPLRFTFETGGRDGIYFPMRITGLQTKPFDINLYVFYRAWINDRINAYGYERQGFQRNFRDWDSRACEPNAGKQWWQAKKDPYLRDYAKRLPTVTKFFKTHHSGARFYLTNIQAHGLRPKKVLAASNDLWLFPYYTNAKFTPFDKRDGGPAVD